jgi:adenylosuccinate lyase
MKKLILPLPTDDRYGALDPLDGRYYDPEIATYLSERSRIACQAHMEAALAQTLAEFKICSRAVADEITAAAGRVTAEEVEAEEAVTRHDVKALVNSIKSKISDDAKPYVHFGATSYDIVASAMALQMRASVQDMVVPRLRKLLKTLLVLTKKYAKTTQIGRTHGQHAVPITFGFAMAEYVARLGESMEKLDALAAALRGKFSGATGTYNALSIFVDDPLKFEAAVLKKVDLLPAPYSTQILPAEYFVRIIDELSVTAGIMANLGHDMRHLQRSEIAEIRERFEDGQTGSSTMAHKRNPINFENVASLAKQVTSQIINANLNLSSEHQRDLTDSSSARFYGVALAGVASMAARLERAMAKIEVDEANMRRNLALSGGAIAAEPLYLLLEKYGHTAGHETAKRVAHSALETSQTLAEAAQNDAEIADYWRNKFTNEEKRIIERPETAYTGLAAKKAMTIYNFWLERN